jgi:kynurenine formamidase
MPVGNVWAWDVPFQTQRITTIERHGFELFMITMHSETGTRLMPPCLSDPTLPKIDELDLRSLVLRDTLVVDLPKGPGEEITAEDIEMAVVPAGLGEGEALLIRTGWGDGERYYELGDDYARQTPHFAQSGAERLVAFMKERKSDLLASDIAYYGWGGRYMLPEWASKPPWERPPFPSPEAIRYLHAYTLEKVRADWGSAAVFTAGRIMLVAALVNCGALTRQRVKLIILPLKIRGGAAAPCRVVALEEV